MLQAWISPIDWHNPNRWAVYSHTLPMAPPDQQPSWIGYCRAPDVLQAPDARLAAAWLQQVAPYPQVQLTVHTLHDTGREAMREALRMIRLYKPPVNGAEPLPAPGNTRRVQCMETGEIFDSAADVCRKYGIHKSQFSVYMSRKDGKRLRGLSFVYC